MTSSSQNDFELEVSSSSRSHPKENLLDGDTSTFWETCSATGAAPTAFLPHWIRLTRKHGGCLRELIVIVWKRDNNYVPNKVSIFAGDDRQTLKRLVSTQLFAKLCLDGCTRVDLMQEAEHMSRDYRVVEIRIEQNVENGIQTRIYGLQVKFDALEPPSNLLLHLRQLFDDSTCSDVIFTTGGEDIHAHRCILTARSPVMRALLTNGMSESTPGARIEVPDVEPAVLRELFSYFYTDQLSAAGAEMADKLLFAADKYQVERLSYLCESHLVGKISVETCCDLLAVGASRGCGRLSEAALEFAVEHADAVLGTDGMRRLVEQSPELLVGLFAAAKLGAKRGRTACEVFGAPAKRAR
mmetsp:Transcript_108254/g.305122  ORF Transcript_108254/g.305122 Transcript_108254/m.305122 type:complete len:355 (+) Transcript_108254:25-1089(+)